MKLSEFRELYGRGEEQPKREAQEHQGDQGDLWSEFPLPRTEVKTKDLVEVIRARVDKAAKLGDAPRFIGGPRLRSGRHYDLVDFISKPDGTAGDPVDAFLKFGKWGKESPYRVSAIAGVDPSYLTWILTQGEGGGFPEELLAVVRRYA